MLEGTKPSREKIKLTTKALVKTTNAVTQLNDLSYSVTKSRVSQALEPIKT